MASQNPSQKIRVGVLRGGPSGEYDVSLKTGKNVIDALHGNQAYNVYDIYIDRSGAWHFNGVARPIERILPHVDVAVNALHGKYGEDGRVQHILESHRIPFTGSGSLGSAIGMNKPLAKKHFRMHGLLTPEHIEIKKDDFSADFLQKVRALHPHLRVVRPSLSSSRVEKIILENHDGLEDALSKAFEYADSLIIEEYIKGRQIGCGVIQNSSNGIHALHPIGDLGSAETSTIQNAAIAAHQALGLRHYSHSDFVVNRFGTYVVEVRVLPELDSAAQFSQALSKAGITLGEFLEHVITLAMEKKG